MTDSRELAEQAFALLRDALEESESQRLDLEDRLRVRSPDDSERDRSPESLNAELDELRAERDLWKKTAGQLQDVVSNERSKAKRLAKKLGVAEAGSDRVARREVNFWREKAESFEESRRRYQQRIYELKEALNAREEQVEAQQSHQAKLEELERANALLGERETRIAELSGTIESSRLQNQELRQRIAELDAETRNLSQQVIDAEAARNEACRAADQIDAELKDLRAHTATYEQSSAALQHELEQQRNLNQEYQRRIDELETQHDREISALRDEHANETRALNETHAARLAQAEEQRAALEQEAEQQHNLREDYDRRLAELESRHDQDMQALSEAHSAELSQAEAKRAELEHQLEADRARESTELAELREQYAELEQRLEEERARYAEHLEHRDAEQRAREQMHASALTKERADTAEALKAEFEPRVAALTAQLDEQSNAFAALEAELAEERNRSDNLNELANERRETLTKTTEKLEEMEERYEDAKWHLGKARHFEKLVRRRKKLITNLIKTIRARQKANNSLKAGLDSLRRYKANADERQQELLRRSEVLENSLSETREKLNQANQALRSNENTAPAPPDNLTEEIQQLRKQAAAQAEVIENLEADLKSARMAETEARTRLRDHEKLHDDLETKNTFIGTLQKDIEEHQRTVAQLRKREIEIKELRALADDHERKLRLLQTENAQLRNAKNGEIDAIDQQKIAGQEQAIARLTAKLKEYEATITTLSEAADSWKRKYDFISAETPYGYESASSE